MDQIQSLNFSRKNFEGTVTAATTFGLLEADGGELSERGERFALGSEGERRTILLEAILEYPAYELLLEAIADRGDEATPLEWIETWWSTNEFGNSESNRSEGSTSFAKLVEFLNLGNYLRGRRGYQTRIEWDEEAFKRIQEARYRNSSDRLDGETEESGPSQSALPDDPSTPRVAPAEQKAGSPPSRDLVNLTYPLEGGRLVEIRLPSRLTPDEKERLFSVLEHLVVVKDELDLDE